LKIILFIIIGASSLFITSCKDVCSCKKVACPAFNDPLFDKWFPYNANSRFIFKTAAGKTDTVTIDNFNKSSGYEANQGCYNGASGCTQQIFVSANPVDSSSIIKLNLSYSINTAFTSALTTKSLLFNLYQLTIRATDITTQGLVLDPSGSIQTQSLSSVNLNSNIFPNVQILQRDTSVIKTTGPYKLYLSAGAGLVAYETYPLAELWVKQ
jgi:hypothetical protein